MIDQLIKSNNGICVIHFTPVEIEALLSVLQLAKTAASMVAQQEAAKNKNSNQMTRLASDANELMRIVSDSVGIGEPETEEIH